MCRGVDVAAGPASSDGDQGVVEGVEVGTPDLVDGSLDRREPRADRPGGFVGVAAQDDPGGRVEGAQGANEGQPFAFRLSVGTVESDHGDVRKEDTGLRQDHLGVMGVGHDAEVRPTVNARTERFQLGTIRHAGHQNGHH